jgi:hypothetical protein
MKNLGNYLRNLEQFKYLEKINKEEVILPSGNGFKDLNQKVFTVVKEYLLF